MPTREPSGVNQSTKTTNATTQMAIGNIVRTLSRVDEQLTRRLRETHPVREAGAMAMERPVMIVTQTRVRATDSTSASPGGRSG